MEKLDEKGFVFIDNNNRPYWCRLYYGSPWFMYWHDAQKSWVTLKKVTELDVAFANGHKISEEMAEHYHKLHSEFERKGNF